MSVYHEFFIILYNICPIINPYSYNLGQRGKNLRGIHCKTNANNFVLQMQNMMQTFSSHPLPIQNKTPKSTGS